MIFLWSHIKQQAPPARVFCQSVISWDVASPSFYSSLLDTTLFYPQSLRRMKFNRCPFSFLQVYDCVSKYWWRIICPASDRSHIDCLFWYGQPDHVINLSETSYLLACVCCARDVLLISNNCAKTRLFIVIVYLPGILQASLVWVVFLKGRNTSVQNTSTYQRTINIELPKRRGSKLWKSGRCDK